MAHHAEIASYHFQIISIKDNDSLAAMLAAEVQADLLILMSDVDGIYTAPPSQEGAKLLWTFTSSMQNDVQFGRKSRVDTGGMDSKVSHPHFKLEYATDSHIMDIPSLIYVYIYMLW